MLKKILFISVVFLFLATAGKVFADAAAQLEQATSHYEIGNYGEAERVYQTIVADYPGSEHAFQAQKMLAVLNIDTGNDTAAQAAAEKLLTDFSENENIVMAVFEVAERYYWYQKYGQFNQLYPFIVDSNSQDENTMWSQMGVALLNIDLGKTEAAKAATDRLLTNFSGNEHLAKAVCYVAEQYYWSGNHDKANQLYRYIIDNHSQGEYALLSQKAAALLNIGLGNYAAAHAGVDNLIANFSGEFALPEALYSIADRYERSKKYEEAKSVYEQIIQLYPDSPQAGMARLDIPKGQIFLFIEAGDDSATGAATDKLFADYSGHSYLPWVLSRRIAEQYYIKASQLKNEGLESQAGDYFQKAIALWGKVINELPASDAIAEAWYWSGDCYRKLGEYEKSAGCYQKVVDDWPDYDYAWNALFLVGRNYESLKESGLISKSQADSKIKAAYEQLLEQYPDCKAAGIAGRWLSGHNSK